MKLGGVGVNVDTNKALGLKINGKNGVIGLGLFRIKSKLFGGSKVLIMGDGDRGDDDMPIFLDPQETPGDDV